MMVLLKRMVKEVAEKPLEGSLWKRYQGVLILLVGQVTLLGLYLLFRGDSKGPQRKAL